MTKMMKMCKICTTFIYGDMVTVRFNFNRHLRECHPEDERVKECNRLQGEIVELEEKLRSVISELGFPAERVNKGDVNGK